MLVRILICAAFMLSHPASALSAETGFCGALAKLNWSDETSWRTATAAVAPTPVDGSATPTEDDPEIVRSFERLMQPNKPNATLASDLAEFSDSSIMFNYFHHVVGTDLYYFGNVQGSGKCRYDIWAEAKDGTLRETATQPFEGSEACDVDILFGRFEGTPLVMQFRYERASPLDGGQPSAVNVAAVDQTRWTHGCSFRLR